jgi:predicted phosphodiesterase
MRLLVFGDLHGESRWQQHVENIDHYDYVIFMGDYMDSFTHFDTELIDNLTKLINFKAMYPNKVILLLGNHDNQYAFSDFYETRCSGFRQHIYLYAKARYKNNMDLFQAAFQVEDILFTHGGLLNVHYEALNRIIKKEENMRYDTYLNMIFNEKPRMMLLVSAFRGGDDSHSGIFWTDWRELLAEKNILPINQVVGHTASFGGDFEMRGKNFIFNSDSILKNDTFHEIYKNENQTWIVKKQKLSVLENKHKQYS